MMNTVRVVILTLAVLSSIQCSFAFTQTRKQPCYRTGVYVYRSSHWIGGFGAHLLIDGREFGVLRNGRYLYTNLRPGHHTLSYVYRDLFRPKFVNYPFYIHKGQIKYIQMEWGPTNELQYHAPTFGSGSTFGFALPKYNFSFHEVSYFVASRG